MSKLLAVAAAAALALTLSTPLPALAHAGRQDCAAAAEAAKAAIDAACPCDGAAHPEHVRCVTKKLKELSACKPDANGQRTCGSVPRVCVGKIRKVASRSACGKAAETVTCCVARQRDCVGDANPGDGKQDGTCSGTKRKCDRVTDCMVPKCELAATAERCTAVGGTVGKSRDCATACAE